MNAQLELARYSKLALRLIGDIIDPDELTEAFGHAPSVGRKKGDTWLAQKTGETHEAYTGCWILHAPVSETGDLDWQAQWVFSQLTEDFSVWKRTAETHPIELYIRVYSKGDDRGIQLSSETLDEISLRGIYLTVEFFRE